MAEMLLLLVEPVNTSAYIVTHPDISSPVFQDGGYLFVLIAPLSFKSGRYFFAELFLGLY